MSDPQAWCLLIGLVVALALIAWAVYAEIRIQIVTGQLSLLQMKEKYADADSKNHALSDVDLDSQLSKDLGSGTKPTG